MFRSRAAGAGAPAGATGTRTRWSPLGLYRVVVTAVAAWSLFATTLLVWFLAEGGLQAFVELIRAPGLLVSSRAEPAWAIGAVGAFVLFAVAFLLSQAVGRGLLRLLAPRPIDWPSRLARPAVPVRLLAFASDRADAFTFTLLHPSLRPPGRREEVILVSDGLLRALAPEEVEAVVAHELGHVRDFDGRYLAFLRTFARLMRWDPILAAVASRLTRREEFRADDEAVAQTGRPRALARAIYKASSLTPPARGALAGLLGPGGAPGRRQALERIRRLVALAERGGFEEEGGA
ncbi:MAG TPA: M56 family metallopeptidase [Thermoplasmata archaeon]|nr:M56 family metallopeptidase [Thermoplasmata archaeon]